VVEGWRDKTPDSFGFSLKVPQTITHEKCLSHSTLNRTVIDRSEQLQSDARTAKLISINVPVVVFVNNHFAGYAHDTVATLLATLKNDETPF
jgi:uncharacterized protein YecE (DUF72 family)